MIKIIGRGQREVDPTIMVEVLEEDMILHRGVLETITRQIMMCLDVK